MMRRTVTVLEKLVIVESPNKVIKVEGLLSDPKVIPDWSFKQDRLRSVSVGAEKVVAMATTGHFMSLKEIHWTPRPVPPNNEEDTNVAAEAFPPHGTLADFTLEWQLLPGRRIQETLERYIQDKLHNVSEIILATDPDREGELIAVHAMQTIKRLYPKLRVPFSRAYMHSITEDGIQRAMKERLVHTCDYDLANAAETRHAMDRIFGFLGSSVVRAANAQMRSIGRVQTPALILIQEREEKIASFLEKNKMTYMIDLTCKFPAADGTQFTQVTSLRPDRKGDPASWKTEEEARECVEEWQLSRSSGYTVPHDPITTVVDSPPPEPFTMATIIAKANRRLKMSSEEVSSSLQDLFQQGYITYPRTDSTRIDESALNTIYSTIRKSYGKGMLYRLEDRTSTDVSKKSSKKKKKSKPQQRHANTTNPHEQPKGNVEDAHEAIRPTDINAEADSLSLPHHTRAVYDLVRRNTLAAFMIPMQSEKISTTVRFTSGNGTRLFLVLDGKRVREPGWTRAFHRDDASPSVLIADEMETEEREDTPTVRSLSQEEFNALTHLKRTLSTTTYAHEFAITDTCVRANRPTPPNPHTEGSLIEELKNNGVGRPSTYPVIVKTLITRGYIRVNAKGRCETTPIGRLVVSTAKSTFPSIVDIGFTSSFEKELDSIAKPNPSKSPSFLRAAKLSQADYVLSMFLSTFLNYVTEATREQRGSIVERSMRLREAQKEPETNPHAMEEAFEEDLIAAKEKVSRSVPDLARLPQTSHNFTALQRGLVDFLRRHFPPSQLSANAANAHTSNGVEIQQAAHKRKETKSSEAI